MKNKTVSTKHTYGTKFRTILLRKCIMQDTHFTQKRNILIFELYQTIFRKYNPVKHYSNL